jgi:chromatin remodeling complex protein RSC6
MRTEDKVVATAAAANKHTQPEKATTTTATTKKGVNNAQSSERNTKDVMKDVAGTNGNANGSGKRKKRSDTDTDAKTTTTRSNVEGDITADISANENDNKPKKAKNAETSPSEQNAKEEGENVDDGPEEGAKKGQEDLFSVLQEGLQSIVTIIKTTSKNLNALKKEHLRVSKASTLVGVKKKQKKQKKQQRGEDDKPRVASGFTKPAPVSDELCAFFDVEPGTHMARTKVTKDISKYIKSNGLQNPEDKQQIRPDARLATLLIVPEDKRGEPITYFSMQNYMKHNFPKRAAKTAVSEGDRLTEKVADDNVAEARP